MGKKIKLFGGKLDKAFNDVKGGIKQTGKNIDKGTKKVVADIKKGVGAVIHKIDDVPFLPLIPFKGLMKNFLNKHNVPHGEDISELTITFAKYLGNNPKLMSSVSNFEYQKSSMNAEDSEDIKPADLVGAAIQAGSGNPAGLIKVVLQFLKNLKKKKDNGQTLTPDEQNILSASEVVVAQIQEAGMSAKIDKVADTAKDFVFSWKIGVVLALIGLMILVYKKG